MTNKAIFIKELGDFRGKAVLVKFEPPLNHQDWLDHEFEQVDYAAISSANTVDHGFETLIFPANESGKITSWGDIGGGPGMDWSEALESIGYEPVDIELDRSEVQEALSRLKKWDVPLKDGFTWVEVSAESATLAWTKAIIQGHDVDPDFTLVRGAE
jgi:hypothetical protein